MANFTNFNFTDVPADTDFVVGYKGDGSAEQRTTVGDLLSTGLAYNGISILNSGEIYLTGGPAHAQSMTIDYDKNITNNSTQMIYTVNNSSNTGPLSGGMTLGWLNSAFGGYDRGRLVTGNAGTIICGNYNLVDSYATDVNGNNNYVVSDGSNIKGFANTAGYYNCSIEGLFNTTGRILTIAKTVSSTNTIYFHEQFGAYATSNGYIGVGAKILIDGHVSSGSQVYGPTFRRRYFTVASTDPDYRSVTVVEPLTSLASLGFGQYLDDRPYSNKIYVVAIAGYSGSSNNQIQGAHVEGMYNYGLGRSVHVEGQNNVAVGTGGHAEGLANYANAVCHAEGVDTKAGMGIVYWESYNAATKTFQLFTNSLSTLNSYDLSLIDPGVTVMYLVDNAVGTSSARRNVTKIIALSADVVANTITSLSAVYANDVGASFNRNRQLLFHAATYAHSEGNGTTARGQSSHAEGRLTIAIGNASHAAGNQATARHDYSYAWSSGSEGSGGANFETTRTKQYAISAAGGVYMLSNVGIGTDSIDNALTVVGTVSTKGDLFSPNFATHVKNASYPTLSSILTNNSGYFNSQGTFASPGGFIIKGHSPDYNTSIQNLPGKGTYGMWLQNVDSMDPGTTFVSDGRAQVTHAMSFRAGIDTFTGGSDHNHVQWQGAPANNTQAWQMTNGGDWTTSNSFSNTNRFMVHTLPQYQISTTMVATSGYFDTTFANYTTNASIISGVKLVVSNAETNNYDLLGTGDVIGLTINPGLVGLVAVTYNSQIASISSNNVNLSAYTLNLYTVPNNLNLANRGVAYVSLKQRSQGGNPGVFKITSQIGNPASQYVGLTGNYKNVPKHVLAKFTTSSILTGFKPGSPLTVWIPDSMPSSSSLGYGFVTSSKNAAPDGNFRYGYFDAFVKTISGNELVFSIGNLMDTYGFEHRTWSLSAAGNAGWVIYGGSQDTVHRPTFGTTGFYFEREPWFFTSSDNFGYLSGGMVKNVALGNSESYGNYSYGLGYRGTVLGNKSATLAGDMNYVYGNNSVAIGGEGLISKNNNQTIVGKFNDPVNVYYYSPLFVVGAGTSDKDRKNILEVRDNYASIKGQLDVSQSIYTSDFFNGKSITDICNYVPDVRDLALINQYTVIAAADPFTSLSAVVLPEKLNNNRIVGYEYIPGIKITVANFLDDSIPNFTTKLRVKMPADVPGGIYFHNGAALASTPYLILSAGYIAEFIVNPAPDFSYGAYYCTKLEKMIKVP
jgi:hypothetical protein